MFLDCLEEREANMLVLWPFEKRVGQGHFLENNQHLESRFNTSFHAIQNKFRQASSPLSAKIVPEFLLSYHGWIDLPVLHLQISNCVMGT